MSMATSSQQDIVARVRDAEALCHAGRYEGALLLLIASVDAAARIRYPKLGPKERFLRFVRAEVPVLTDSGCVRIGKLSIGYGDGNISIEEFLYYVFRCSLVHEAGIDRVHATFDARNDLFLARQDNGAWLFGGWLLAGLARVLFSVPETGLSRSGGRFLLSTWLSYGGWSYPIVEDVVSRCVNAPTGAPCEVVQASTQWSVFNNLSYLDGPDFGYPVVIRRGGVNA